LSPMLSKFLALLGFPRKKLDGEPAVSGSQEGIQARILEVLEHLGIPAFFFHSAAQTFTANREFFRATGIPDAPSSRWVYEFPLVGEMVSGEVTVLRLSGTEHRVIPLPMEETVLFVISKFREEERWLSELQFFLTALGHEVKTPLTVIKGYTQILREELGGRVEIVEKLQEQILRLEETLQNLRNLSFLGKKGSISWKEAQEIVTLVAANWKDEIRRKNLRWEYTPDSERPETVIALSRGDFFLLFSNLFSNAVKFSVPRGRITLSVDFEEEKLLLRLGNSLSADVSPQELLGKWENFRKMRELPEKSLGIYLIEKTLERVGGKLEVDFGSQGEVIFRLSLPLEMGTGV